MNRWGIMVDVSHPSKGAMMQAIGLSKAPVIASHSAVRKLANHSRNMDDEMLMAMKTNGGVVQMVALVGLRQGRSSRNARRRSRRCGRSSRCRQDAAAGPGRRTGRRDTGRAAVSGRIRAATARGAGSGAPGGRGAAAGLDTLTPDRRAEFQRRLAEIDQKWPAAGRATVKDFVDHIDYAVKLIGVDHVGISSDFDGGGGIDGWNSAAETFNVTLELVRRGYTEEQIGKIWSGNLLRVWAEVEKVAETRRPRSGAAC